MNKLKLMRTFMLIVEEGSIVKAADRLGITKAAASKQLIDLETNLHTQLIHRTTRALKVSDIGQLYYESVKRIFSAIKEADLMIDTNCEQPTGILKIVSHRNFGEKYIVRNMKELTELYPNLIIDLELSDRFPDLEKENIDILCGAGQEGPYHLVRKKLDTVHHVLCAAPEYIDSYGVPSIPEDLKKHRYITHSFRNPDNLIMFNNHKEIYVDFHIRLNDAQAMLNCALQGIGIIKIYNYFVDDLIKEGKLVELLKKYREPPKSIYLFYQQQKFVAIKIRAFIDFLMKKIS